MGEPAVIAGRVLDLAGDAGAGRGVDVWQATTTASTTCSSRTGSRSATCAACSRPTTRAATGSAAIVPAWYPIPDDGPVGELLAATGRHPNRPAHIHVIGPAPRGHAPVTTHVFLAGEP